MLVKGTLKSLQIPNLCKDGFDLFLRKISHGTPWRNSTSQGVLKRDGVATSL